MSTPTRLLRRATLAVALGSLCLAACGGDDDTSSSTAGSATTAATTVIEVDADGGTPGTRTVALGTSVSFHIVSATDQEFHLHGYDIEDEGTDVTMTFVADQAGTFDLESHATDTLLFTLVVAG